MRYLLKQDLPSLKYYDEARASQAYQRFNRPSVLAAANITTITSFNVDVSAIDNNPAAQSHLMLESPIAASMLMNAPIGGKDKHRDNFECYDNVEAVYNEKEDYGV